jgi:hypothetical protein
MNLSEPDMHCLTAMAKLKGQGTENDKLHIFSARPEQTKQGGFENSYY